MRDLREKFWRRSAFLGVALGIAATAPRADSADPIWQQQQQLIAQNGAASDFFGWSVAVSGDTVIIGAREDSGKAPNFNGSAYIFVRNGTTWSLQQRIIANDGAASDRFGHSVAISGNTAIVGTLNGFDAGKAYVFVRNNGIWTQQQKLVAADPVIGSRFGISVSISGESVVVGAQGFGAYVFVRTNGSWSQQAKLLPPNPASPGYFGWSVSISKETAAVGDLADQGKGSASVFVRSGATWTRQKTIIPGDAMDGDRFGYAVALDADTLVGGSSTLDFQNNPLRQFAYVYTRGDGSWPNQAMLTSSEVNANASFGGKVAVSGDTLLVGANGAAYVFSRSGTGWMPGPTPKLTASDGAPNDSFGFSVAVDGATAVVGAAAHKVNANVAQGAAYVFLDTDIDGDALPDKWETSGFTVSGSGGVTAGNTGNGTFVDLPAMGADPRHKDIFVHADWMGPDPDRPNVIFKPNAKTIKVVTDAFLRAPVTNPDGTPGIRLHVDLGSDRVMNPLTGQQWGSFTAADAVPYQEHLGSGVGDSYNWAEVDLLKEQHFIPAKRQPAFHYVIFCNNYDGAKASSGLSRGVGAPAGDFLIALGQIGGGTVMQLAGTFMHELGHNLGLLHGGNDDVKFKPNYLSTMNYTFQMEGLFRTNGQRFHDYSRTVLPELIEGGLKENAGIGTSDFYTFWKQVAPDNLYYRLFGSTALDWNFNGVKDAADVQADINHDNLQTTLKSFNDWPALRFDGGGRIGAGASVIEPATTVADEASIAELLSIVPVELQNEEGVAPQDVVTVTQSPTDSSTFTFDGSGSTAVAATIVSWSWDFGDGTNGSGAAASHTYSASGIYFATLTVVDSNGRVNLVPLISVITVPPAPTPTPTPTATPNPTATPSATASGSPTATPSATPMQGRYVFTKMLDSEQVFASRTFHFVQTPPQISSNSRTLVFGAQVDDANHNLVDIGYFKMSEGGQPITIADSAAGQAGSSQFAAFPFINASGAVSWTGGGFQNASIPFGIYVSGGGTNTTIASNAAGQPFLDFQNATTMINSNGTVVFRGRLRNGDGGSGIFTGDGSGPATTVADSANFFNVGTPAINDAGTVVFAGWNAQEVRCIFMSQNGVITTLVDASGQFSSFGDPSINSVGDVAFTAFRDNGSQGVFRVSGGVVTTVADNSGPYQDFTLRAVSINDRGTVVFQASLRGTLDPGLFTGPDPVLHKIIAAGDALFGDTVATLACYRGLNNNNDIAFVYRLTTKVGGRFVEGLAVASPRTVLANISTRAQIETGDNVVIDGFIVTGTQPKKFIVRGIGPSLPLAARLEDPILELYNSAGQLVESNDNWGDAPNQQEIVASKIPPAAVKESAILRSLAPGAYTAILRGASQTTGLGLVEVYDLDLTLDAQLANISTRGPVQTDARVMIGGFIISGSAPQKVIVRAIGPSLPVEGRLQDPVVELYNGQGDRIASNDDWRSDQEAEIIASTIPPLDDREAAIVRTLSPGAYTAIVRGKDNTTGVGLVEVYALP